MLQMAYYKTRNTGTRNDGTRNTRWTAEHRRNNRNAAEQRSTTIEHWRNNETLKQRQWNNKQEKEDEIIIFIYSRLKVH